MPEITLKIKGLDRWARRLDDTAKRQLPFATKEAINSTLKDMKTDLEAEMERVFDRPTPWTMRSMRIVYAKKRHLSGAVAVKDKATKGTPAATYLRRQIKGTPRPAKGFESWLRHKGLLPRNEYALPSRNVRLNRYGNITIGMHRKIKAALEAQGTQKFFIPRPGSTLAPGVYQRMARRKVQAKFIFVKTQPKYRARFPFAATAARTFRQNFSSNFRKAFEAALRTAR